MLSAIAPVSIHRRPRTLTFTGQEEAASLAPVVLLRRVIERKIALEPGRLRLDEIDAILVCAAAVTALAMPFHTAHSSCRVRVTSRPHAGHALVLRHQKFLHV